MKRGTPGPWVANASFDHVRIVGPKNDRGLRPVVASVGTKNRPHGFYDAELIAEAPALLEHLEDILKVLENPSNPNLVFDLLSIRATIKRAKGGV